MTGKLLAGVFLACGAAVLVAVTVRVVVLVWP